MTHLVERLVELRRYLDHLRAIRPKITSAAALERDLTLHNDVLFSLLTVCQSVIDIAGELSARRGERFEDYTQAVKNLAHDARFSAALAARLQKLPGFRNVLVHEYVALDLGRVVEAVDELDAVEDFLMVVREIEREGGQPRSS